MQRIERYGVVVLLFMMVTFVAVAMWDGGEGAPPAASKGQRVAAAERTVATQPNQQAQNPRRRLPLSNAPEGRSTVRPNAARGSNPSVQTRVEQRAPQAATGFPAPPRATQASVRDEPKTSSRPVRLERPRWSSEERPGSNTASKKRFEQELKQARGTSTTTPESKPRRPATRPASQPATRTAEPVARRAEPVKRPQQSSSRAGVYVVKSGDTLSGIAQTALGSSKRWREIAALNPKVDPGRLFVGAKLALPGAVPTTAPKSQRKPETRSTPRSVSPSAAEAVYIVQSGDMLSTIAQRELGSAKHWRKIADLNPKVNPDRLYVGAKLRLPAGLAPTSSQLVASAEPETTRNRRNKVR